MIPAKLAPQPTCAPWRSLSPAQWGWRQPGRTQQWGMAFRVAAQAARKQSKPKGGKRPPSKKAARDFEGLSIAWDDVFEALCKATCSLIPASTLWTHRQDPSKAEQLEQMAAQGYSTHGRGFLFVRSKVASRSKKTAAKSGQASKGFGAAPPPGPAGTPLPNNPALLELGWSATYIPSRYLSSLGGIFSQGSALLPHAAQLAGAAVSAAGEGGPSSQQTTTAAAAGEVPELLPSSGSTAGTAGAAAGVDPPLLDELGRALRGMDAGRLGGLVGAALPAPRLRPQSPQPQPQPQGEMVGGEGGGDGGQGQDQRSEEDVEEEEDGWVGGERAYEPESREFVVLLLARVDMQPAIGADIVMAVTEEGAEGARTQLVLPGLEGLEELALA